MRSTILAPLALACGMAAAQAQPIYRCGDSYSQQPCPGGHAIGGEAAPTPSAQERKQAAAAAQRDARLAEQLERERLKEEARPAQLYIPPPRQDGELDAYRTPEKKATRKLDVFTASAPGSKPAGREAGEKKKAGKKADHPAADKDARKAAPAGKPAAGVLVTPR